MEITALTAALAPLSPTPGPQPSELAARRFAAIMNAPEPQAPALTGLQAALQTAFAPAVDAAPATLGNQILASLRSTTTEYSEKWQNISGRLDAMSSAPAIADMLRLQADLVQVSVQYELVGKAVSRTTQNIDSLVRMS
ncbi:EscI/YscI/HrpB family type III secretion system inner rod protein [Achromobacter xylosoxidans]|jgi:type III secretion protein I|nr:type III secretion protein [Achromobacter xylosoxidans]KOQ31644.1 type III secretion protein [Achromobacter xylosoxidans]KOQ35692.1 type III secretion protein [Achromobacter xylosoxidans]KOQ46937.1 type III secretion protein [Achromobacter xylosoxidans]KOQ49462.1 type III secretion protein [Achromobacter xylosoxidans]